MTSFEVYELLTQGGATTFERLVAAFDPEIAYCLIGDSAINCYVEQVYTLDADLVVIGPQLSGLSAHLLPWASRSR